ncbi:MAG: hypothetical protein CMJ77_22500 [Planctomycetaceae bacterium]|nr:hypothetical protein [Planctomycetaceae bacterium]
MEIPSHLRVACFALALASCLAMRADASLQVDLDLNDSKNGWALVVASELSSDVVTTSAPSSSSSSGQEERPESGAEIRAKLSHSNLPASSASGSGNVVSDGGGAEAPAVSSIANSTADQTLMRRVYDRGQWIPDEPIFSLLKVPRLQTA